MTVLYNMDDLQRRLEQSESYGIGVGISTRELRGMLEDIHRLVGMVCASNTHTKVVYIAGPFRAATAYEIELNVRVAEARALEVWRLGAAAICPHANTRFFHGAAPDELWLSGDLELLRRCDALITCRGYENSSGAKAEIEFARANGIPIFHHILDLHMWLAPQPKAQEVVPV